MTKKLNGSMVQITWAKNKSLKPSVIDIDQSIRDLSNGSLTVSDEMLLKDGDLMDEDVMALLEASYIAMINGYKIQMNLLLFDSMINYRSDDIHQVMGDMNYCDDVIQIILHYLSDSIYETDGLCAYCSNKFDRNNDRLPYMCPKDTKYFYGYENWLRKTKIDQNKAILHFDCMKDITDYFDDCDWRR